MEVYQRHLNVQYEGLGVVFRVHRLAEVRPDRPDVGPVHVAPGPQERGEVDALFGGRGPYGLVVGPPLLFARRPLVDMVEVARLPVVALALDGRVGKLIAYDIVVTRIQSCWKKDLKHGKVEFSKDPRK